MTEMMTRSARAVEHLQQYVDDVLEAFHSGSGAAPGKISQPITLPIAKELIKRQICRVVHDEINLPPHVSFRLEGKDTSLLAWVQQMCGKTQGQWAFRFAGARGDEPAVLFATVYGVENPVALIDNGFLAARQCDLLLRDWYAL